jgi:hypothetical protein
VRTPGGFVATMERRFETIAMRVHADQAPRLVVGDRSVDLAVWGNGSLRVSAATCARR